MIMGVIQQQTTAEIGTWYSQKNVSVDVLISRKNFCESLIADYATKTDADSIALRTAAAGYYNNVVVPTLNANQAAVASNAVIKAQVGNPALDSPLGNQIVIATENLAAQASAQAKLSQAAGNVIAAPIDLTFVDSTGKNSQAVQGNKNSLLVLGAIVVVAFLLTR
jgi:hypothetical protein